MTMLFTPADGKSTTDFSKIQKFFLDRGVELARWTTTAQLTETATQEEILAAYEHELKPYMKRKGFQSCDVINVYPSMENKEEIRKKFIAEHTHSEDEVRFFVEGEGKFWFHLPSDEVFCLICTEGDFLSVPAGVKHWFDLAPHYHVKAIRIFTNKEGWVANYTKSNIDEKYNAIIF